MVRLETTYANELLGQYVPWIPVKVKAPKLLRLNQALARQLGFVVEGLHPEHLADFFSGNKRLPGSFSLAQAYAGHQFGAFSQRLGDGRALLLGEIVDRAGHRYDIALKGSGPTPFSRGGDGKAAVGSVLREYLIGEAMYALGIPTTRALAAVHTGEIIYRDRPLPGAVLTRVASSHLRIGTFEFFSASGNVGQLRKLVDYAIRRHDSGLIDHTDHLVEWLKAVSNRQARLIASMDAHWIYSWRHEYRQYDNLRGNNRLWTLCIHGDI